MGRCTTIGAPAFSALQSKSIDLNARPQHARLRRSPSTLFEIPCRPSNSQEDAKLGRRCSTLDTAAEGGCSCGSSARTSEPCAQLKIDWERGGLRIKLFTARNPASFLRHVFVCFWERLQGRDRVQHRNHGRALIVCFSLFTTSWIWIWIWIKLP
jgi:hypothetical protein